MIYFFGGVVYNKLMKKMRRRILKNNRNIKLLAKDVKMDLRMIMAGDFSVVQNLSDEDLNILDSLESQSTLFDFTLSKSKDFENVNIYALMDEGVLKAQPTGADLGIYDYEPIENEKVAVRKTYDYSKTVNGYKPETIVCNSDDSEEDVYETNKDDLQFRYCVLAEGNSMGGEDTDIIITFKGYLEVTTAKFSFIRRCDGESAKFSLVYMPEYYIRKYQLRNGDEIVCTCKESNGKMLMTSLMTINGVPYYRWECERPWFKNLAIYNRPRKVKVSGEFTEVIDKKLKLLKGDNVFIYINKNSQKATTLNVMMTEFCQSFDKVVYINPHCKDFAEILDEHNIVKFCAGLEDDLKVKKAVTLMGSNYAKRLVELNCNIAIIIDDVEAIAVLDADNEIERPVATTVLNSAKATKDGASTSFTIISLKLNTLKSFSKNNIFRSVETLGIVIDKNQVDLYHSYRV